jgi:hypothetical protein
LLSKISAVYGKHRTRGMADSWKTVEPRNPRTLFKRLTPR